MLEELVLLHQEVMGTTPLSFKRYLFPLINWRASGICILGDRGVGKTTMLCQHLLETYKTPDRALYLSADHINVISYGLVNIAQYFFSYGGEALYIDEVHKYPNWSIEIKNIVDTYKGRQIIFSGSSSLDLNKSKADLSRRVVYHKLLGLSFREFALLSADLHLPRLTLPEILNDHVVIASSFNTISILELFRNYLTYGYYPFFMEGIEDYQSKVHNVIEKILFEDIAVIYNLRQTTMPILKKILWLVATSDGLLPNIDKMSKNLGVSREMVYNCIEYLHSSGLLQDLFSSTKGNSLIRKPSKLYINNVNLLHAINGSLKMESELGGIRETFFVNQVSSLHKVTLHDKGDFLIDGTWVVEVGGRNKGDKQIKCEEKAFLAIDDIKTGFGNRIPLYLFGLLY